MRSLISPRNAFGAVIVSIAILGAPQARAAAASCSTFKEAFLKATSDLKSNFVRPLTVTRGGQEKDDVFDLVSAVPGDITLTCRGESFVRFEADVTVPASKAIMTNFGHLQKSAMMSAFGWTAAHAEKAFHTINREAAEYLRASIQRGDIVLSGKTEYHEGGSDLGMMYTPHEQTFVIVGDN